MISNPKASAKLEKALITIDSSGAEKIIATLAEEHNSIHASIETITEVLKKIGVDWERGILSLSQVFMSSIICEEIIDKFLPENDSSVLDHPKIAIGVFEDHHLLGKRIVSSTLRASGYKVMDLGGGLSIDAILRKIEENEIEVLLLSTLMLNSALKIKDLQKKLDSSNVKIIAGGAPFRFDTDLWKELGIYASGTGSQDAIEILGQLMEEYK